MKKGIRIRETNIADLEDQENPGLTWGNGDVSNCSDDNDDDASSGDVSQY